VSSLQPGTLICGGGWHWRTPPGWQVCRVATSAGVPRPLRLLTTAVNNCDGNAVGPTVATAAAAAVAAMVRKAVVVTLLAVVDSGRGAQLAAPPAIS